MLISKNEFIVFIRFYSDDANKNNQYRAASYTVVLRDYGTNGYLLPPVLVGINHCSINVGHVL